MVHSQPQNTGEGRRESPEAAYTGVFVSRSCETVVRALQSAYLYRHDQSLPGIESSKEALVVGGIGTGLGCAASERTMENREMPSPQEEARYSWGKNTALESFQ